MHAKDTFSQQYSNRRDIVRQILEEAAPGGITVADLNQEAARRWGDAPGHHPVQVSSILNGMVDAGVEIWQKIPNVSEPVRLAPGLGMTGKLYIPAEGKKEASLQGHGTRDAGHGTDGLSKNSTVVKRNDGWHVISQKGKHLGGPYDSREKALKRLRQVEYFKRQGARGNGEMRNAKCELPGASVLRHVSDATLYRSYCEASREITEGAERAPQHTAALRSSAGALRMALAREMARRGLFHVGKKKDGRGESTPEDVKGYAEDLKEKEGIKEPYGLAWYIRERHKARGKIKGETKHNRKEYEQLRSQNERAGREKKQKS